MPAKVFSAALIGLEAAPIEVEVDLSGGLSVFNIVGLPDKAVEESKERVNAALKNSGALSPQKRSQRIIVNLAPADLKKEGSLYDLPIAVGYLLASGQIMFDYKERIFCGELALDGSLRRVKGVLAITDFAKKAGFKEIFLAKENAKEAGLIPGIVIRPISRLSKLISHFSGGEEIKEEPPSLLFKELSRQNEYVLDFAFIKGQEQAKRALELAASGGHNVLFSGTPGAGKTLLAKSFPSILPEMEIEEALEVTKIFSVAGLLPPEKPLLLERPFRSPHHSASSISLIGGGTFPRPGEVTLAHRGVLFLDEFPELPRSALEALRQPMEDGYVIISRAAATIKFPASFTLIAAMNPCPCGNLNDPVKECICAPSQIHRYKRRLSGPILDRIDIHVNVPRVKYEKLSSDEPEEFSKIIRARVKKARALQQERFKKEKFFLNSEMSNRQIKTYCELNESLKHLMKNAVNQFNLSARAYFRILKVARTAADLEGSEKIKETHLAEAIQYRVEGGRD